MPAVAYNINTMCQNYKTHYIRLMTFSRIFVKHNILAKEFKKYDKNNPNMKMCVLITLKI